MAKQKQQPLTPNDIFCEQARLIALNPSIRKPILEMMHKVLSQYRVDRWRMNIDVLAHIIFAYLCGIGIVMLLSRV